MINEPRVQEKTEENVIFTVFFLGLIFEKKFFFWAKPSRREVIQSLNVDFDCS